jgi:hypothetical protein
MLQCRICGYSHPSIIAPLHIKKHGLSTAEYKQKFPDAVMRVQTAESKAKMSASKIGKPSKLKGVPKSIQAIENQRQSLKEGYASGRIKHWNTGRATPPEIREKIADGNRKASNAGNQLQRSKKHERMHQAANSFNCSILSIDDERGLAVACCNKCATTFQFTNQIFYPSRLKNTQKLCPMCQPRLTFSSQSEQEVADFIEACGQKIIRNDRSVLGGFEIDIFVPDLKLGFEFTGLYWHAEKQNNNRLHLLWKMQHAAKVGVQLINIFEDEWKSKREIVESKIRNLLKIEGRRIFARHTQIDIVDSRQAQQFLNHNHIQGKDTSTIKLGLYFKNELVQLATFKKTNVVKGGRGEHWELSRLCALNNTRVIGGASKLITHFNCEFNTERSPLISFADRRWSNGNVYRALGFKYVGETSPSYWYILDRYTRRVHRSSFMKHRLLEKFNGDPSKSEWELAQEVGLDRIWDCGTTKWVLDSSTNQKPI